MLSLPLNTRAPSYQKVVREENDQDDEDDGEKICRICLEEDEPESMIAPCKCKGGSKWVHRECLDEWRTNEKDRAFSKCTECLFQYHMQPIGDHQDEAASERRRRIQFYMMVSRDACFLTIMVQMIIAWFGCIVRICDRNARIPGFINNERHPVAAYYLCGWLVLLVLLGFYGSVLLCQNGCNPARAIQNQQEERDQQTYTTTRTTIYRERRRRYRRYRRNMDAEFCCRCCASMPPYDCECCCCYDSQQSSCCNGGGGNSDCTCCCDMPRGGESGSNSDGAHILLVILLVIAIIMAVIGIFVGLVIAVISGQRIVQQHIHLLHKRQLVREFQVMDLAAYDLDQLPAASPPAAHLEEQEDEEIEMMASTQTPPTSSLKDEDSLYLKKIGLMEDN